MQDDLQKAYSAYQHALYSLPNPKVFAHHSFVEERFPYCQIGKSEIVVWDWNPLRPVWVLGQCRGGFLVSPEDGQGYARTCSTPIYI
jgi:hypothetical protein